MFKILARCLVAFPLLACFVLDAFAITPATTAHVRGKGTVVSPFMPTAPYMDWGFISMAAGNYTPDSCAVTIGVVKQPLALLEIDYYGTGPDSLLLEFKFPGTAAVYAVRIVGDSAKRKDYWAFQCAAEWVRFKPLTTATGAKWRWNSSHVPK